MQVPGSAQIGIIFHIGGHMARSRAFAEIDNRWIAFSHPALQLEASRIPLIEENTCRIQTGLPHLMQEISSEGVSSEPAYPANTIAQPHETDRDVEFCPGHSPGVVICLFQGKIVISDEHRHRFSK